MLSSPGPACLLASLLATLLIRRRQLAREQRERDQWASAELAGIIAKAIATDQRLGYSASRLAKGIRQGEFTSEEVVQLFIDHLKRVNVFMNAIVATRFEFALVEARLADARIKSGEANPPPFLGVPYLSKECIEFPNLPYTCGITSRKSILGKTMAPAHALLAEQGFVCLGVGNVPELCLHVDSFNNIFGATRNPYDLSRSVGGSSGGTAAAVASLCAPVGLASDLGGSARIPACYTGIFGHKPSGGAVSVERSIPARRGRLDFFCQLGPMARQAEDLLPMLRAICTQTHLLRGWQAPMEWPKLTVVDIRAQPGSRTGLGLFVSTRSTSSVQAQERVLAHLTSLGCNVLADCRFPLLDEAFDVFTATLTHDLFESGLPMRVELAQSSGTGYRGSRLWAQVELARWCLSGGLASEFSWPAISAVALASLMELPIPGQTRLRTSVPTVLALQLEEAMGDYGVMIMSSMPTSAPELGSFMFALRNAEIASLSIFNMLGFPSTQVPMGLSPDGLPFGLQVVSKRGNDHLCIRVAEELQRAGIAGWVPPPQRALPRE